MNSAEYRTFMLHTVLVKLVMAIVLAVLLPCIVLMV